ncbi:MAG: exo 1,3/1,4-beta-D-glucan glucohydrolase [Gammaproteobacteria bacterium]|nr:exo 1,3/1,4-beta-D-glucan glucohydrolase [Gammaproteobacteria bacterium]MBU1479738.1 exo 1,3/1,4-beta-D-glucan glucohydrolase [Gammaproteobacteria bacterium]MBU2001713.1 exo 1,3/1,4-beta-D-glucan glucohydrolase [Gammaproteobacteria bacterium]MBU2132579.1 exo 1,3/1,4-beta-D-glucan glucohydrolase [Gammaproteobacteria bacterium]MBU2188448.1 exo 1,3/1,4-beta-D-glucan glucohydrolase [Gammaproteobacteria bacterium]
MSVIVLKPKTFSLSLLAVLTCASLSGCSKTDQIKADDSQSVKPNDVAASSSPNSPNGYRIDGKPTDINIWPQLTIPHKNQADVEKRVADLLAKMTIEQKVAQMIQPEIRDITVEDMRKYGFGSYLNGGGSYPNQDKHATPADWIALADAMFQASMDDSLDGISIPTMWGTDAVHGHNNVIGATLFPHNIGLGAAHHPELIQQIAAITAKEVMVTGIDWVFAPTVAVVRDDRWGRTYEGYSEDPVIVKSYSHAIVEGLQGGNDKDFLSDQHVIATVKHFLGDGGTEGGDDQGDNLASEQTLFDIHAQGYVGGLTAGAQTVMASFNSWHGAKNHGNPYLLTDVLKTRMGFDGLVVGDWNGHGQVEGCSNESCPQAVNAGLDVFMVPTAAWKPLYENTVAQVKSGLISQARIDDAVSRILRVKIRAGLFEKPSPAKRPLSGKTELIGQASHRDVARQAVRESLVLLKNNQHLLPLSPKAKVLVAGDAADNIGKQSGGWSITWQGTDNQNADFPGATSIYAGIAKAVSASGGSAVLSVDGQFEAANKPDVAIVVFGEEPYAEGNGDIDNLEYQRGNKRDLALLQKLKAAGVPVVSVFISGRPLWVNPELNASDAFVAAWLPGTEGAGIAEVLFTQANGDVQYDFTGKLSFSWPSTPQQTQVNVHDSDYSPLLPYGYGLSYADKADSTAPAILSNSLSEDNFSEQVPLSQKPLFERAVKAPWKMWIGSIDGDKISMEPIASSVQTNEVVTIKTFDKQVQEDARHVSFNGKVLGFVSLQGNFPEDLRAYLASKSVLSIQVKVSSSITAPVNVGMICEGDCRANVDISSQLSALSLDTWSELNIDLTCYQKQGIDFAKIISPFTLSSSGTVDISFSDIILKPKTANMVSVECP